MTSPPFFKLSLELRNEVYGYILICNYPVHVTKESDDEDWAFTRCTGIALVGTMSCECSTDNAAFLDVALLCVSKQVQQEAMAVLMGRNIVALRVFGLCELNEFAETFGGRCAAIQSVELRIAMVDRELAEHDAKCLQSFCKALQDLRRLDVLRVRVMKIGQHKELWVDGILNHF